MSIKGVIGRHYCTIQKLNRPRAIMKCNIIYNSGEIIPPITQKLPLLIARKSFSNFFTLNKLNAHFRLQRLHRPFPIILMACPVLTSAVLACPYEITINELYKMGLLFMGCITSRTAGCIINDIFDRKFDKHVSRTKTRPLASGELSVNEGKVKLI